MADMTSFIDFLEDDSLTLTGIPSDKFPNGKDYVVQSPDAETGMRLAAMGDVILRASFGHDIDQRTKDKFKLDDDEERELMDEVLGETGEEMIADGVKWVHLRGIIKYTFAHFALGAEQAEKMKENGILSGKAPEPSNRAERRQKPKTRAARPASSGSSKAKGKGKAKG